MIVTLTKISNKLWKATTAGYVQDVTSEIHLPNGAKDIEVISSVRRDYPQADIRLSSNVRLTADIRCILANRSQKWDCPNNDTACSLRGHCVNHNCEFYRGAA